MAEVYVTITDTKTGVTIRHDNPVVVPFQPGAGQLVTQQKDSSGKVVKTSGTTAGVVHNNPA